MTSALAFHLRAAVLVLMLAACGGDEREGIVDPGPDGPDGADGADGEPDSIDTAVGPNKPGRPDEACKVRGNVQALSLIDRSILGSPVDYEADPLLRTKERELVSSQRARREVAWAIAAKVLRDVSLPEGLPNVPDARIPAFQTWHASDDLKRMFNHAYPELSPDERRARAPFADGALRRTFAWNDRAIDELEEWTDERIAAYRAAIDDASKVAGLGGVTRVAYSPRASEHLLASYGAALDCDDKDPDELSPAPETKTEVLYARTLELARCSDAALDPMALTEHDEVVVKWSAARGDGKLSARFLPAYAATPVTCEPTDDAPCTFTGEGDLVLSASSERRPLTGKLEVTRTRTSRPFAPCLKSAFPAAAVVIKADWRRAGLGIQLPVYDTSAEGLAARFDGVEHPAWTTPDRKLDPGPEEIYTLTLPNGNRFRLAALHIMTKELDHWVWTTLWWSDRPDEDFGADRPVTIPKAFGHYKMCTTVAFAEQDPDPTGGYASEHPSLARALAQTHAGKGGASWCSNPYLEEGAGNAVTNCIGCHQHAGTYVRSEVVLGEPARFPDHGRTRLREDFPSDYVYALTAGDRLGALFREAELHFATPEP